MQTTAVGILLAGFVFVFFRIPFVGFDLLVDAVGFLLIFNALWGMDKLYKGFLPAGRVALALVPVSAVQLFVSGNALAVVGCIRGVGECVLFLLARQSFSRFLKTQGWLWESGLCTGAFVVNAAVSLTTGILHLASPSLLATGAVAVVVFLSRLFLLLAVLRLLLLTDKRLHTEPGPSAGQE